MYRACHFRPRKHRLATTGLALAMAIATHQAQSRACTAEVEVHDRAQDRVLPTYRKFGRRWITGEPGHEYDLRIRNCADVRVLAVISVDGVNVITGESASPSQSGYVLEPGEHLTVEGWRKSMEHTAAFVFTDPADSYAARTGRPNDLGVIGVALFRELRPKVVAQEWNSGLYAVPSSPGGAGCGGRGKVGCRFLAQSPLGVARHRPRAQRALTGTVDQLRARERRPGRDDQHPLRNARRAGRAGCAAAQVVPGSGSGALSAAWFRAGPVTRTAYGRNCRCHVCAPYSVSHAGARCRRYRDG